MFLCVHRWLTDFFNNPSSKRLARDLLLLAAFTLALHAPFLRQPVQGDEVNYLDMAAHVLQQPLTPLNFEFVFQGKMVDAAGHPHPPLNAYILAVAWLLRGHFSVFFFHCFYLLFTLGISFAAYALAARFTSRPLWGALLIAASPIVQVNTNTLASPEAPALALLLIGAAAFFGRRFWLAGIALALAGLTELQALALPPILLLAYFVKREDAAAASGPGVPGPYGWIRIPPAGAWCALAAPYLALGGWQALQWALTGRLPFVVLAGYASNPNLSRIGVKASSALALLGHLGVLVTLVPLAWRRLWGLAPGLLAGFLVTDYPWWERALLVIFVALGVNALVWLWDSRRQPVLAAWCLLYFAFACVAFFAGAARYLLPLAAPMVLLFVIQFRDRPRVLWLALAVNVVLGLNISFAAYEFARVYAHVAPPPGNRFLVNGEWGFRYYMVAKGGQPLQDVSAPIPGEWIVASDLSLAGKYDSLAEETAVPLRSVDLRVRTPLRLVDRHAHTGNSSASMGLLPFSFSNQPLDRITYSRTSSFIGAPAAWTPTEFNGHLVYVPNPAPPAQSGADGAPSGPVRARPPGRAPAGIAFRLPLGSQGTLHFALFGNGNGPATFRIQRLTGEPLFSETVQVAGDLWEPHILPLQGLDEALLFVDAPPAVRVGWGELVLDSNQPAPELQGAKPAGMLSYLNLGDIRSRAQLVSGWYAIEDGSWRWMAPEAEAILRPLPDQAVQFELQLFFPPDFMRRAGSPVTVSVMLNGKPFTKAIYFEPGGHRLAKLVPRELLGELLTSPTTHVSIRVNPSIPPTATDQRALGAVVQGLGFVAGQ
ncbi:MAG: hypothetical protein ABSE35_13345 [Bryobacteraceae bacterium]